jgi:tetratricopeptide (TPR) repeat protein
LWWDKERYVARTEAGLRELKNPPWLFLSWADGEEDIEVASKKLVGALTRRPVAGLRMEHRYYRGEDHMSTTHRALYDALELHFSGWRMQPPSEKEPLTLARVEAHYAALSKRFGFEVTPSALAFETVALGLSERGQKEQALEVLKRNAAAHPWLTESHHALGRALEGLGRREEALRAYEDAVRVAVEDDAPYGSPVGEHRGDPVEVYRAKVKQLGGK